MQVIEIDSSDSDSEVHFMGYGSPSKHVGRLVIAQACVSLQDVNSRFGSILPVAVKGLKRPSARNAILLMGT